MSLSLLRFNNIALALLFSSFISCQKNTQQTQSPKKLTFVEDNSLKSHLIIGSDKNRIQTVNMDEEAKLSTGKLRSKTTNSDIYYHCTATIIGGNFLLTAAHCIYDKATGKVYDQIEFFPALNENLRLSSRTLVSHVWVLKNFEKQMKDLREDKLLNHVKGDPYYNSRSVLNDMALLKTYNNKENEDLEHQYSRVKIAAIESGDSFSNTKSMIVAYPADKKENGQWWEICSTSRKNPHSNFAYMTCDTAGGSSGAALLIYSKKHKTYFAQGVAVAEEAENGKNVVLLISTYMATEINNIMYGEAVELYIFKAIPF